ncbi:MAG TPA: ABC transporter permease [Puia sp.]|nr:ABC transporter permease [Puia sp.]
MIRTLTVSKPNIWTDKHHPNHLTPNPLQSWHKLRAPQCMLKNYILTTLRSLRNKPTYSLLNVAGLALGIACAALIFLWVEDELTWDHQVPQRSQIYWTRLNMPFNGAITSFDNVPGPLAPEAIKTVPGIRHAVRLANERHLFTIGDKIMYEDGSFADSGYFSMLNIPFLKGTPAGCLRLKHSIVLTESTARKFFGDAEPIGKVLVMDNHINCTVTGVVPDFAKNVTLRFNWLVSFEDYTDEQQWLTTWGSFGRPCILELEPGIRPEDIAQKLTDLIRPKDMAYTKVDMLLWPMKEWHLYSNFTNGKQDGGAIKLVKLFSLIASIILLIACINFMNLATARAGQRAREVGVRKTLGALKGSLIGRFISESLMLSFLSVLLAVLLIYISLPAFNELVNKDLSFHPLAPAHLIGLLTIGIGCGLLSGSYPAFYLSSFNPVAVLKGLKVRTKGSAGFIRKGLVTTQFVISIALIICTAIIYQQIQHVKERDLGFRQKDLLYLDAQGNMAQHFDVIRDHLMATGAIDHVALSFSPPLSCWSGMDNQHFIWEGDDQNSKEFINHEVVTPGYIAAMGLKIKEGRDFYSDANADSNSIIINESLAAMMGKAGKTGSRIIFFDGQTRTPMTVVGIVRNYVFNDMYGKPAPIFMACNPKYFEDCHSLDLRLKPGTNPSTAIAKITAVIKADNPGYPIEVKFADNQYNQLFTNETRIGKLAGLFAALAISISCLGLFGLAAYTAEQRTKELGIRKVLGASIHSLTGLLSREFLQLVLLSCLIAFPLAGWVMNSWLASYAYRTALHWWVFAAAGVGALLIALLTVSFQALKAALANPVKTLRSE